MALVEMDYFFNQAQLSLKATLVKLLSRTVRRGEIHNV
jgi:hypothetical protein